MLVQLFLFDDFEQPANIPIKQLLIPDNFSKEWFDKRIVWEHEEVVKIGGFENRDTKLKILFLHKIDEDLNWLKIDSSDGPVFFPKVFTNLITATTRINGKIKIAWKTTKG